mmetsp:Transcript_16616/g.27541  ORF Transcript_16616/g.27541 Transcript_16616/m.27541 type:complete len:233 (-) Transcript_16616:126-824(-)
MTNITAGPSILFLLLLLSSCQSFLFPTSTGRHVSLIKASPEDVAKELREQAEKLREQVAAFQQEKDDVVEAERQQEQDIRQEKQAVRNRYSAEVPIFKGDGSTVVEQIDFPPRFPNDTSRIKVIEAPLPLGMILGESEDMPGLTIVDEVAGDSNAALAGVKIGDIVRACTACRAMMKAPTWQILAGGIGRPETSRFMYNIDGRPFEEVMEAVGSNRMDPQARPVVLVIERRD